MKNYFWMNDANNADNNVDPDKYDLDFETIQKLQRYIAVWNVNRNKNQMQKYI